MGIDMRYTGFAVFILFVIPGFIVPAANGQEIKVNSEREQAWAVPTFECLGLYFNCDIDRGECKAQYRQDDESSWREALPLVYDARDKQYRGSLVGLKPDTAYNIRLACDNQEIEFNGRTRKEQFPIGKTTHLSGSELDQPVRITESGTEDAWHLVAPAPGQKTIVDVFNLHDNCIEVAADYVIIRGLELKNAGRHAVLIREGVQNVVVEDCHMTQWGRVGGAHVWGIMHGSDSAIYAETGAGGLILQRNLIEHPPAVQGTHCRVRERCCFGSLHCIRRDR